MTKITIEAKRGFQKLGFDDDLGRQLTAYEQVLAALRLMQEEEANSDLKKELREIQPGDIVHFNLEDEIQKAIERRLKKED